MQIYSIVLSQIVELLLLLLIIEPRGGVADEEDSQRRLFVTTSEMKGKERRKMSFTNPVRDVSAHARANIRTAETHNRINPPGNEQTTLKVIT